MYNLEEGSGQLRPKNSIVLLCEVVIWDMKKKGKEKKPKQQPGKFDGSSWH